jgi:uncharacterized protein YdhG (YjbR/CyaY superfamily)
MDIKQSKTIDAYIAAFPAGVQVILEKLRQIIKDAAPGAQEVISYGMPTFKLKGNLVHFAAHQKHIGFYPTPSAIVAFKKDLVAYAFSKGAIRFPIDQPIPYGLVEKMVKFRVNEVLNKN